MDDIQASHQNQPDDDRHLKDVLAKARSLLDKPAKISAVLTFEPISFKQMHRIVGKASNQIIDAHNRSMPMALAMSKSAKQDQLEEVDKLEFKNRLSANHNQHLDDHDQSSFFVPDVELGTNILFTYFLHALEIERLVRINQDFVQECKELDDEASELLSKCETLKAALKKSEDERSVVKDRYATLQANYANQTQLEQELREEIRKLQGKIARNKLTFEQDLSELRKENAKQAAQLSLLKCKSSSEPPEQLAPQNNQNRLSVKPLQSGELTRPMQIDPDKVDPMKQKDSSTAGQELDHLKDAFISRLRERDQDIIMSERIVKAYPILRANSPTVSHARQPQEKVSQLIIGGAKDKQLSPALPPQPATSALINHQLSADRFAAFNPTARIEDGRRPVVGQAVQLYPAPQNPASPPNNPSASKFEIEVSGPISERVCNSSTVHKELHTYKKQPFPFGLRSDRERLSFHEPVLGVYRPFLASSGKKPLSKPHSHMAGHHDSSS